MPEQPWLRLPSSPSLHMPSPGMFGLLRLLPSDVFWGSFLRPTSTKREFLWGSGGSSDSPWVWGLSGSPCGDRTLQFYLTGVLYLIGLFWVRRFESLTCTSLYTCWVSLAVSPLPCRRFDPSFSQKYFSLLSSDLVRAILLIGCSTFELCRGDLAPNEVPKQ